MAHADYANYNENASKEETLQSVVDSYNALSAETDNWVANLANCASLVWHAYQSLQVPVNWAGFYVLNPQNSDELILGPFQGKVACQIIRIGKGVCGNAASSRQTQLVKNVHEYPGHIACDGDTKSEIVVPIIANGHVVGVLDIDCLELAGFDEQDQQILEQLAKDVAGSCKW